MVITIGFGLSENFELTDEFNKKNEPEIFIFFITKRKKTVLSSFFVS